MDMAHNVGQMLSYFKSTFQTLLCRKSITANSITFRPLNIPTSHAPST